MTLRFLTLNLFACLLLVSCAATNTRGPHENRPELRIGPLDRGQIGVVIVAEFQPTSQPSANARAEVIHTLLKREVFEILSSKGYSPVESNVQVVPAFRNLTTVEAARMVTSMISESLAGLIIVKADVFIGEEKVPEVSGGTKVVEKTVVDFGTYAIRSDGTLGYRPSERFQFPNISVKSTTVRSFLLGSLVPVPQISTRHEVESLSDEQLVRALLMPLRRDLAPT